VQRVFVLGDTNLDIICRIDRVPGMGQEFNIDSIDFSIGGNGANFSVALGKLGVSVHLFSVIGNDFSTNFLVGELWSSGAKPNLFKSDRMNGYSIVLIHKNGERRILSNKGATEELRLDMFRDEMLREIIKDDILFIPGFFHHKNIHAELVSVLETLKERGVKIMFDLCFDKSNLWMGTLRKHIPQIDVLFLNKTELQGLTKAKDVDTGIRKLHESGLDKIVLKMGSEGSAYFSGEASFREDALKVNCMDSLAAGDVFNAGWIYGFVNGKSEQSCLKIGNFVAGKKIQNHGIVVPSRKDIREFVSNLV
jgi:sugar/nucleoside kinase (ribokinase family)